MFENRDIMQTSGNPPRLPPRSTGRQGNNWFHGCCGVSFAKVPVSLPPTWRAGAGGVLRGRGIISDSCQPSALFGIMFLLGVILRLQKSCCLYSEKQRKQGRRGAGGGWLALPKQIYKNKKKVCFCSTRMHPSACSKIENYYKLRPGVTPQCCAQRMKCSKGVKGTIIANATTLENIIPNST